MNKHHVMMATVLALALGACGGQSDPDADVAAAADQPVLEAPASASTVPAPPLQPVVLAPDAIALGTSVDASGAVAAPKTTFAAGDTVHVSVPTAGRAQGAEVLVYWMGPDGKSLKEERKKIGAGEFVNFSFGRADGLAAGKFMVQVDVADQPVGMTDFQVR